MTPYEQLKEDILDKVREILPYEINGVPSKKYAEMILEKVSAALDEIALEVAKAGRVEEKESELRKFHGYFEANEGFNAAISQSQNQLKEYGVPEKI